MSAQTREAPALKCRGTVPCESHLVDDGLDERIEDEPVEGSYPCEEPAVWRVTFRGGATGDGAALRLKCDDCGLSARDAFGDEVALRRL